MRGFLRRTGIFLGRAIVSLGLGARGDGQVAYKPPARSVRVEVLTAPRALALASPAQRRVRLLTPARSVEVL
jgi:hypothetical protein